MLRGERQKCLDIDRIAEIAKATGLFLTLHGASGTNDEELRRAIRAGITEIHINTELRLAWRRGLEGAFEKAREEVVPYKLLPAAVDAMKQVITARLLLFGEGQGTGSVQRDSLIQVPSPRKSTQWLCRR